MWQESLQLRAFMRRMMSSELSKGWNSWLESWEESIRKRNSLRHMMNRELSKGLNAWAEMVAMRAEYMQQLRYGLGYMMNRQLALGFAGWRAGWESALEQNAAAAKLSRAPNYAINRDLAGAGSAGPRRGGGGAQARAIRRPDPSPSATCRGVERVARVRQDALQ